MENYKETLLKRIKIMEKYIELKHIPRYLFKYRENNDYTKKIVTDNEIYFSSPNDFNDPFDCNTSIDTENASRETIENFLIQAGIEKHNLKANADELQKNPKLAKGFVEKTMSNMGICCFSSIDDNILLWSHYANYHKGICFKFDIQEDAEFFLTPMAVDYRQILPHHNPYQREDTIKYLIQPKYSEWSYESEVRVVKEAEYIRYNGGNRVFKYKDPALKEIIFGMKTITEDIDEYKNLCRESGKTDVLFFQMKLDTENSHYKLKKELI